MMVSLQKRRGCGTVLHSRFSWRQLALLLQAAILLTACGGGTSTTGNNVVGNNLSANVEAAHVSLPARPEILEFRDIKSAGSKCAALPQDVTLTLGTPKKGKFSVFDDAHDGKELCYTYTSFNDSVLESEIVLITVKNPDGTDFPGSGLVELYVWDTYNTHTDTNPPAPNHAPTANAGADQEVTEGETVNLSGSGTDPDSDPLTYSWVQTGGTPLVTPPTGATTVTPFFTAPQVTADSTLTFTLTVNDGHGGTANDTVSVLVKDNPVVQPTPTSKLNDTGITKCGDYSADHSGQPNNDVACSRLNDDDGDPVPLGQDGHYGRDVTHNDDSDGHAGFSFTKISGNGQALPAAATEWGCVKDNATGLIWEAKTDDAGLHDKDWTYTWHEPDGTKNGGDVGTQNGGNCGGTSQCDTHAYVQAANTAGWCGANDWQIPTKEELRSIVDYDRCAPAIDTAYFPNTPSGWFWSSSPATDGGYYAWVFYFSCGLEGGPKSTFTVRIMLTMSG